MKRILLPVGGAILATGLLAAGLAGAAQADPDVDAAALAASQQKAAEVLNFWTKSNNAALRGATAYYWDNKDVKKIVEKGGYVADGKPGSTPPIGAEKKVTVKSQNVNLPKSIGKVFFEGRDGKLYWCSGTSIQSNYRNLVATAGHCVYDIAANDEVVSRWVFVPGYYQGKAPWGIYVGKQAFTHYDFSNYEDFDRDYAFVTVYNGVGGVLGAKNTEVLKSEFDAYKGIGDKYFEDKEVTKADWDALAAKYGSGAVDPVNGPLIQVAEGETTDKVGHDYAGKKTLTDLEVDYKTWYNAPDSTNWNKNGEQSKTGHDGVVVTPVSESQYNEFVKNKADGKELGFAIKQGDTVKSRNWTWTSDGWYIVRTYVKQWYKKTDIKYIVRHYFIVEHDIKDVGRLGDNVGGQGFAWNQPTGKYVRTFGYPQGKHPDGSKPYSGVTPKWCYGKTGAKQTKVASLKIEEHVSLKCAVTAGYNGAPWLLKYSNAKRMGYVNGVTSIFFDTDSNDRWDYISSPYFDGETNSVYAAAANVWSGSLIPKA